MLSYIDYLGIPAKIALLIIGLFFVMQLIGEILEFKGKVVPEFVKVRKYFSRKKRERETIKEVQITLDAVKNSLNEMNAHYSVDNIKMRDDWMKKVNS